MKINAFFKALTLCLAVAALAATVSAKGSESYWYCKRNSEHKQPACDPDLAYIEDVGGIWIDRNHGDENGEKVIYLTFDVGYENGNVEKVLDTLKEEGVTASFFILGNVINRTPELVMRMANEGHAVCNHTVNHKNLTSADEQTLNDEILGLEQAYEGLTGKKMSKFFRPPEGTFNKQMLERVEKLGYKTVFWSFAYADWDNKSQMSESAALKKICDNLHNGEIMLLHPTGETNAKIMKTLIGELKSQGYRFATLEELA